MSRAGGSDYFHPGLRESKEIDVATGEIRFHVRHSEKTDRQTVDIMSIHKMGSKFTG